MAWKRRVKAKQILGVISGSTANEVSPTSPRVTLFNASSFTENPSRGAANLSSVASLRISVEGEVVHTENQETVRKGIHGPQVGSPVGMAETSRERKESAQNLRNLTFGGERAKGNPEYSEDTSAEFDTVEELDTENGLR
jgi:hypothetical protein